MQKSNSGFYAAAAVLLALLSLYYSWKFIVPNYQSNQAKMAHTDKEISAAKTKLDSLQTTKNNLDQLGGLVDKLFVAVPGEKDSADIITEVEAIGAKSQLSIPSIQITDGGVVSSSGATAAPSVASPVATSAGGLNPVSVSFSLTGTFEQLNQILSDLEKDLRFTNVKSVTFATSKDNTLTFAIQMEVYRRAAVAATPASLSTLPAALTK